MNLAKVQAEAWANKLDKGFNTTDVLADARRINGEVTEFEQAHTAGDLDAAALELADVVIYAAGLAEMIGVNLDHAVEQKLRINRQRTYTRSAAGKLVKVERDHG